jgi:hypothetical protein
MKARLRTSPALCNASSMHILTFRIVPCLAFQGGLMRLIRVPGDWDLPLLMKYVCMCIAKDDYCAFRGHGPHVNLINFHFQLPKTHLKVQTKGMTRADRCMNNLCTYGTYAPRLANAPVKFHLIASPKFFFLQRWQNMNDLRFHENKLFFSELVISFLWSGLRPGVYPNH